MPRELPIYDLGKVEELARTENDERKYFHTFGIFKKERHQGLEFCFCLFDEYRDIEIRLVGTQTDYPRPKPGDIIRFHRSHINTTLRKAEVQNARNIVIWPAFQHEPQPIHVSRNPTINEADRIRRRTLESYYCTRISQLKDLCTNRPLNFMFHDVAGRVENILVDDYGHLEIQITDGTETMILWVFKKRLAHEDDCHFKTAEKLQREQYIIATNVKVGERKKLHLSANTQHGRSLRVVEKSSILGTRLSESLNRRAQALQSTSGNTDSSNRPRRSPRSQQQNQDENRPQNESLRSSHSHRDSGGGSQEPSRESFPDFIQYSDIPHKGGFEFYNLVGQVRDKPVIEPYWGNCLLQIFDGSLHDYTNYYVSDVPTPLDGCLILCVYSKQKESDTDEHIQKAYSLKEGDLVYITNVKVSFPTGKIKVELSANKSHNKSITVIDKQSSFGRKILNMAGTPQVAEVRDLNMAETPQVDEMRDIIDSGSDQFPDTSNEHSYSSLPETG